MSIDSTPRERLARILTVLRRVRTYWRSAGAIALVGVGLSFLVALNSKRAWRSETTVLYRETIATNRDGESAAARAARLGPKLKDLLEARPRLSTVITEFGLYPKESERSMVEAVDEMQKHLSFRARNSDTYVISFVHDDPRVAQSVTARLAELMIADYNRENLDTATLTRDFLRRELDEANTALEKASRALAVFLAENPQFQWGAGESPYAPVQGQPGGAPAPARREARPAAPADRELASLEAKLARVVATLEPRAAAAAAGAPVDLADAQKKRDAAAAALAAAEATLAEKLSTLTTAHPDAQAAQGRVEAARRALADADAALRGMQAGRPAPRDEAVDDGLDPGQRADLEHERATLTRRIAERRAAIRGERLPEPRPQAGEKRAGPKPDAVDLETEWHRLRLDLERARDHVHGVEGKARAADMSAAAAERKTASEMQVLDPAYLPTRPDKGRGGVFLVGSFMAILFAFGLSGARVLLDDRLHDEGDVVSAGGPQVLVTLPRIPPADDEAPLRDIVMSVGREPMPPEPVSWSGRGAHRGATEIGIGPAYEDEPPSSPAARARSVTIRWGSPVTHEVIERGVSIVTSEEAGPDSPAAHAVLRRAPERALALAPSRAILEAVLDEPEVEVVGADLDAEGDGAMGLYRATPPAAVAALRVLRHRLEQRRGRGHLVVAVVSPGEAEGKTTVAVRLALALSEAERARVVLVEGNLERPRLARALGIHVPESLGFSTQLHGRMGGRGGAWGVVRLTPALALLAEPGLEAAFPEVLHSTHFDVALRTLGRHFDYVVIDGPPVIGSGDANVVENASDAVLMIARAGRTRGAALLDATDQLGDRRVLGVVLNGAARGGRAGARAS